MEMTQVSELDGPPITSLRNRNETFSHRGKQGGRQIIRLICSPPTPHPTPVWVIISMNGLSLVKHLKTVRCCRLRTVPAERRPVLRGPVMIQAVVDG